MNRYWGEVVQQSRVPPASYFYNALRPVPQRGHRALDHLLVFFGRASGFVDEFSRAIETMRGEKLMGFGGIEAGHGVPVG